MAIRCWINLLARSQSIIFCLGLFLVYLFLARKPEWVTKLCFICLVESLSAWWPCSMLRLERVMGRSGNGLRMVMATTCCQLFVGEQWCGCSRRTRQFYSLVWVTLWSSCTNKAIRYQIGLRWFHTTQNRKKEEENNLCRWQRKVNININDDIYSWSNTNHRVINWWSLLQ